MIMTSIWSVSTVHYDATISKQRQCTSYVLDFIRRLLTTLFTLDHILVWYLLRGVTPPSHSVSKILTYTSYVLFLIHLPCKSKSTCNMKWKITLIVHDVMLGTSSKQEMYRPMPVGADCTVKSSVSIFVLL